MSNQTRMNETNNLIKNITEGILDKKGQKIIIADLTQIEDAICNYFVICQGNSPSQVSVIADSVWECVFKETGQKPTAIDGTRNAQWIVMVFPRAKHRPECYYADNDSQHLISPASVEMGGLIITPRKEDYEQLTPQEIINIYKEVSLSDKETDHITERLNQTL